MRLTAAHGTSSARTLRPARLRPHTRHHDLRRARQLRHGRRHRRRRRAGARSTCASTPASTSIDTADVYSAGLSEEIIGEVARGPPRRRSCSPPRRACRWATGPNDAGLSRHHLIAACEASLRRLRDRPHRPLPGARVGRRHAGRGDVEALDDLVRAGKVRYVGCSNYAGWQLMKALGIPSGTAQRFVSQQIHYSLQAREAEYELVPVGARPGRSASSSGARSPAACCPASSAAARRSRRARASSREWNEPPVRDEDALYDVVDVLVEIARGARRLRGAGRDRLAARPPRRDAR